MKKGSKDTFQLTTSFTPHENLYNNVQSNTNKQERGENTLKYINNVKECKGG